MDLKVMEGIGTIIIVSLLAGLLHRVWTMQDKTNEIQESILYELKNIVSIQERIETNLELVEKNLRKNHDNFEDL